MTAHLLFAVIFFAAFRTHGTTPIRGRRQAMEYLKRYQYMGEKCPLLEMRRKSDVEAFPQALRYFQKKMSLQVTGSLDRPTLLEMNKPRCGVADMINARDGMRRRRKRYTFQGSKWASDNIFYKFLKYSKDLNQSTIERVVDKALAMWGNVTSLRFTRKNGSDPVHIEVSFDVLDHGDSRPFDGPGSVLAHAFFPEFGGATHFDDDEVFTDSTAEGINLLAVAVHEFGHSLGLAHSEEPKAIMFPIYQGYNPDLQLHQDDIQGIQMIYGPKRALTTLTTSTALTTTASQLATPVEVSDFCVNSSVDASFETVFGEIFIFQGDWHVVVGPSGIKAGFPRLIKDTFPHLPGYLDAAFCDFLSVYFLKSTQIWKYDFLFSSRAYVLSTNYPRLVTDFGLPSGVDLAFKWTANGRIYLIKGTNYYRLSYSLDRVDPGYPRHVTDWNLPDPGMPFTAAFSSRIRTFFVAGDQYFRYNDVRQKVDPGYPKLLSKTWYGCEGSHTDLDDDDNQMMTIRPVKMSSCVQRVVITLELMLAMLSVNRTLSSFLT